MRNLILTPLLITLLVGAAAAQGNPAKTMAERDITALMDAQTKAWNAGDLEGFMAGYWRSPQMTFVSGDSVARGWQAALDRYKKNYDSKEKMGTLTFSNLEIRLISRTYATVLGSWSLAREKDNPKGKFTLIFRKFRDGWRIIHDHSS